LIDLQDEVARETIELANLKQLRQLQESSAPTPASGAEPATHAKPVRKAAEISTTPVRENSGSAMPGQLDLLPTAPNSATKPHYQTTPYGRRHADYSKSSQFHNGAV
jgi:hypothetical protein